MAENQANVLKKLSSLNHSEQSKLAAISEIIQHIEQGKMFVEDNVLAVKQAISNKMEENRKASEAGNTAQIPPTAGRKSDKKPRMNSKILELAKGGQESKIAKEKGAIRDLNGRIKTRQLRVTRDEKYVSGLKSDIRKLEQKIEGIKSGNALLEDTKPHMGGFLVNLLIKKNDAEIAKAEKRINALNKRIDVRETEINAQKQHIENLEERVSARQEKIAGYEDKIHRMESIDQLNAPNAALTYFLTDRMGFNADELDQVIMNPRAMINASEQNRGAVTAMALAAEPPVIDENEEPPEFGYYNDYMEELRAERERTETVAAEKFSTTEQAANESDATGRPLISRSIPPEILVLQYNQSSKLAYLSVNEAAFPQGADLTAYNEMCEKFGIYKCENWQDYAMFDERANELRSKIGEITPKPTHEFLSAYLSGNEAGFQQDENNDYPVKLCRNERYGVAWLEPVYEAAANGGAFNESLSQAQERCKTWGVHGCNSGGEYRKLADGLGENAKSVYSAEPQQQYMNEEINVEESESMDLEM